MLHISQSLDRKNINIAAEKEVKNLSTFLAEFLPLLTSHMYETSFLLGHKNESFCFVVKIKIENETSSRFFSQQKFQLSIIALNAFLRAAQLKQSRQFFSSPAKIMKITFQPQIPKHTIIEVAVEL